MRNLLFVLFFIPMLLQAQDTLPYSEFRFTIVEVNGNDLTDDKIEARIAEVFQKRQLLDFKTKRTFRV